MLKFQTLQSFSKAFKIYHGVSPIKYRQEKEKGLIKHIGITTHQCKVAQEIAESGLYETLQYPFSYLAADVDKKIVETCKANDVGFIAMKGLSGGLLTNSKACYAFLGQYDNVMPIWKNKVKVMFSDLKEADAAVLGASALAWE